MVSYDATDRERHTYLGDGVYARFDGYQVWVHTSDGVTKSPEIAFERNTLDALVAYACEMMSEWTKAARDLAAATKETVEEMAKKDATNHDGSPWIGVDLDGTLAFYDHWRRWDHIGPPLQPMVDRIKGWLVEGKTVKIVTARFHNDGRTERCRVTGVMFDSYDVVQVIQNWTLEHIGARLPVTATKDLNMIELWDDRAIQMVPNTGRTLAEEHLAEITALKGKP